MRVDSTVGSSALSFSLALSLCFLSRNCLSVHFIISVCLCVSLSSQYFPLPVSLCVSISPASLSGFALVCFLSLVCLFNSLSLLFPRFPPPSISLPMSLYVSVSSFSPFLSGSVLVCFRSLVFLSVCLLHYLCASFSLSLALSLVLGLQLSLSLSSSALVCFLSLICRLSACFFMSVSFSPCLPPLWLTGHKTPSYLLTYSPSQPLSVSLSPSLSVCLSPSTPLLPLSLPSSLPPSLSPLPPTLSFACR